MWGCHAHLAWIVFLFQKSSLMCVAPDNAAAIAFRIGAKTASMGLSCPFLSLAPTLVAFPLLKGLKLHFWAFKRIGRLSYPFWGISFFICLIVFHRLQSVTFWFALSACYINRGAISFTHQHKALRECKKKGWRTVCKAPVPAWVDTQGQSCRVSEDGYTQEECESFVEKPLDTLKWYSYHPYMVARPFSACHSIGGNVTEM